MSDLHLTNFDVHRDQRGVLTAIINVPDQPVNVFNVGVLHDLDQLLFEVEHDETVKVLVFRSGKESGFLAGADLHEIERLQSESDAREACYAGQELFSRLENLSIPTIAVINGVCLGGGLEFALACRHRLVIDDPRTKLGLPEVELGLLPGWGGTQRLPRCVGLTAALPMLLTGKKVLAHEAVKIGLADCVTTPEHIDRVIAKLVPADLEGSPLDRYRNESTTNPVLLVSGMLDSFVRSHHPRSWRTWFQDRTRLGQWLVLKSAWRRISSIEMHYPALSAILRTVSTGLHAGVGQGFDAEREEFSKLFQTEAHHSLLGLYFQREQARKAETWIRHSAMKPRRVKRVGVVGAGVMGAGIAHWISSQGFDVVLKEVNADLLNMGLNRVRDLFQESVRRHTLTEADATAKIGAIFATTDWRPFADVDLVIEAATERLDLKRDIFRQLELHCPPHAVLVTNTSALSIREIAIPLHDPDRILGLHFFNPVQRMPLIEIVRTDQSHDDDVALLVEFVRKIGKVPVVAADSPGFVVNRVLFPYFDEAVRLNSEGVSAVEIDDVLKRFGMPMGPLELLDQVGLDVAAHVAESLSSLSPEPSPTAERLREMVSRGRLGKKSGDGFYRYSRKGKQKPLTPALSPQSRDESTKPLTSDDIRDRIVLRLANEAAKCLHEGVVPDAWMVDLALVLGTGFAPFTGGPLRMCELQGYSSIVAKLEFFEKTLGPRFAPAAWLMEQIEHPHEHHTW